MTSNKAKCLGKHTKYQPTEDEFRCPKCGTPPSDGLIIDNAEDPPGSISECVLIHDEDALVCNYCGFTTSGRSFAASLVRKAGLVKCEHCRGTGFVKGGASKVTT